MSSTESIVAVRCVACGGSVAWAAGTPAPACVFCDATALVIMTPEEGVEAPEGFLPFAVDESDAERLFRARASASIWYPSDLRHASIVLNAVLVPAWSWSARLETHYTAVITAPETRSNKRPIADAEVWDARGVLVASSPTLSRRELAEISPFESGELDPLSRAELPYELGSLTRTAARSAGEAGMAALHQAAIRDRLAALSVKTSTIFSDRRGGPLLLPVWIGVYRRGEVCHRVVVNGQTGAMTGSFPYSWVKICGAIALGFAVLAIGLGLLNGRL